MSDQFVISLALAVLVVLGARLLLVVLPLPGLARRLTRPDVGLVVVGLLGLAFHCVAMFFRGLVDPLAGADSAISDIRALGTASIIWYVVPAVLVLVGLRHIRPVGLAVTALGFVAVGVTMYNDGPLAIHLTALFTSVTMLAVVVATLVLFPWRTAATGRPEPRSMTP